VESTSRCGANILDKLDQLYNDSKATGGPISEISKDQTRADQKEKLVKLISNLPATCDNVTWLTLGLLNAKVTLHEETGTYEFGR
jgi:hypothetical protein